MSKEKISVCIPFYNIAPYVSRCLNSVLNNTYKNLEVICVNDGSNDDTLSILRMYEQKDSRIIVIDQENSGVAAARENALKNSTGQYIAYIDGDDWVHNRYFEILLQTQKRTMADVVACELKICNDMMLVDKCIDGRLGEMVIGLKDLIKYRTARIRVCGRLYTREIVKNKSVPIGVTLAEDTIYNLIVLCSKEDTRIAVINEQLYYYYQRKNSAVRTIEHKNVVYAAKWLLENIDIAVSRTGKEIIVKQALHSMLAYRYLAMFSSDKNEIRNESKQIYTLCKDNWKYLSVMDIARYKVLYYIPIIYRMIRIISDPTMLDWERKQKLK